MKLFNSCFAYQHQFLCVNVNIDYNYRLIFFVFLFSFVMQLMVNHVKFNFGLPMPRIPVTFRWPCMGNHYSGKHHYCIIKIVHTYLLMNEKKHQTILFWWINEVKWSTFGTNQPLTCHVHSFKLKKKISIEHSLYENVNSSRGKWWCFCPSKKKCTQETLF